MKKGIPKHSLNEDDFKFGFYRNQAIKIIRPLSYPIEDLMERDRE